MDDTLISQSPDPLALSLKGDHQHPSPSRHPSPFTPRKVEALSQKTNIPLQDFYLSTPSAPVIRSASPSKSIAQAENLLSPWRIRVRVEAERSDAPNRLKTQSPSPVRRVMAATKTTTIPLKTGDESAAPAKRPRGRPRKSIDTPIKRKGTPKPRKNTRRETGESLVEGEVNIPAIADTASSGPKRQSIAKRNDDEVDNINVAGEEDETLSPPLGVSRKQENSLSGVSTTGKQRRRRKAMSPIKQRSSLADATADFEDGGIMSAHESEPTPSRQMDEDLRDTDPGISPSPQKTIKRKRETLEGTRHRSPISAYTNPSKHSLASTVNVIHAPGDHQGMEELRNPTEEHREFDSIIESEGFSMVSVSSLSSAKQNFLTSVRKSGVEPTTIEPNGLKKGGSAGSAGSIELNSRRRRVSPVETHATGEYQAGAAQTSLANNHLTTSSDAQNRGNLRGSIQEANTTAESNLVPLPGIRNSPKRKTTTPRLVKVVRAGIALQGILGPRAEADLKSTSTKASTKGIDQSRERINSLFSGFGENTRRELRAGLRLGEELAKRRQSVRQNEDTGFDEDLFLDIAGVSQSKLLTPSESDTNSQVPYHSNDRSELLYPSLESKRSIAAKAQYPVLPVGRFPSPAESVSEHQGKEDFMAGQNNEGSTEGERHEDMNGMSWREDTINAANLSRQSETGIESTRNLEGKTQLRLREQEKEYRLEREAVIREAQRASQSQVIILGSSILPEDSDSDEEVDLQPMYGRHGKREEEDSEQNEEQQQEKDVNKEEEVKEEEEEDEEDIWQIEAEASRQAQNTPADAPEALFPDLVPKPRRGKLPSPWRRQSGSQVIYSDEPPSEHRSQDDTDYFWSSSPVKHIAETPVRLPEHQTYRHDPSHFSTFSDFTRPLDEGSEIDVEDGQDKGMGDGDGDGICYDGDQIAAPDELQMQDIQASIFRDIRDYGGETRDQVDSGSSPPQRSKTPWPVSGEIDEDRTERDLAEISSEAASEEHQPHRDKEQITPLNRSTHQHLNVTFSVPSSARTTSPTQRKWSSAYQRSKSRRTRQSPRPKTKHSPPPSEPLTQSSVEQYLETSIFRNSFTFRGIRAVLPYLPSINPFRSSGSASHISASDAIWKSMNTRATTKGKRRKDIPLSIYLPWTDTHFRSLQTIYLAARANPTAHPFRPATSRSGYLNGMLLSTPDGWSKPIEAWELGVVDSFLDLLDRTGIRDDANMEDLEEDARVYSERFVAESDDLEQWKSKRRCRERITEREIVKRVFGLWCGGVMRGEWVVGRTGTRGPDY
ncbi:hypothetical protein MMC25_007936 [Agyrium rufum]|nr:hypothetical protein [Agyrium rufum]